MGDYGDYLYKLSVRHGREECHCDDGDCDHASCEEEIENLRTRVAQLEAALLSYTGPSTAS